MNFKDWYSQKQAMYVLGMDYKMQIHRKRKHFVIRRICNKPFYLKKSVHDYMEKLIREARDPNLRWDYEARKLKTPSYNVSLKEWAPRCMVVEHFPYSEEVLYTSTLPPAPIIRTREWYNQKFFKLEDVIYYVEISTDISEEIKKKALEGLRDLTN